MLEIIHGNSESVSGQPVIGEYSRWRQVWNRIVLEVWRLRLRRWLPRLVWLGDEVDVCITFPEDALQPGNELGGLFSGGLYDIQKQFRHMGIEFDTGCGADGRDWEWDWSLRGPVQVKFRGRAKHPERRVRQEVPKPRLTVAS
jgi:hypothetical protein